MAHIQSVYDSGNSSPEKGSNGSVDVHHISPNDLFNITLKSNPQNGYMWYLSNNDTTSPSTLMEEKMEPLPRYMGTKQYFTFKCVKKGNHDLTFEYRRSWEALPHSTFTVHLHVN